MTTVHPIAPAFQDDRGNIVDVFNGVIHHTGLITFTPGAVRGNHYHRDQTQYNYILQGEIELRTRDARITDGPVTTHIMRPGDFVSLPPHIIHAYRSITDASMLCLTNLERGSAEAYEQDTVRVPSLF